MDSLITKLRDLLRQRDEIDGQIKNLLQAPAQTCKPKKAPSKKKIEKPAKKKSSAECPKCGATGKKMKKGVCVTCYQRQWLKKRQKSERPAAKPERKINRNFTKPHAPEIISGSPCR
ncbi:MAG TPA: hypothetical protein PK250_07520 [Syntrophobacter fumaroxidans]|nr:hypothetical protein [Syntrophobacter fumaroxidans]